ncbi:MAG: polysaccharide deacetylase family protein [Micromonosporaceae bacterium]
MTRATTAIAIAICATLLVGCGEVGTDTSAKTRMHIPDTTTAAPPKKPSASHSPAETGPPEKANRSRARKKPLGPHGSMRFTDSRAVALTFDDGPSPHWTPKVLALLKKAHVKATFCIIGQEARRHPKLVRAIVRAGHTLCNHSWAHDMDLGARSDRSITSNLLDTNAAIREAAPAAEIKYYRQPGGQWTARLVRVAKSLGMRPLHWDVDPQDWRRPPAGHISHTVIRHTKQGSIVLLHDGGGDRSTTYWALQRILPNLTRRFQLVRL